MLILARKKNESIVIDGDIKGKRPGNPTCEQIDSPVN